MAATVPGQMFSRPENDGHIMTSWERFLSGDETGSDALRRLIDDSWRRCYGASVDPARHRAPEPLGEHSLHSLRDECGELLTASAPVMASARDFLSETGTVMVLTDQSGTILNLEGDMSTRGAAENVHLLSGANWSELACGTNAIGTALAVGQPVQIHSAEHYCAGIKRWSCSATVIRDPYDGSILGVVDVSGLSASYSRHSLALVVATAGRIENRLAKIEMSIRCRLLEDCVDRLSSTSADGIIVFDRRGRAIKANGRATVVLADLGLGEAAVVSDGLASLSVSWKKGGELPDEVPEWMRREWLEPDPERRAYRCGADASRPPQRERRRQQQGRPAGLQLRRGGEGRLRAGGRRVRGAPADGRSGPATGQIPRAGAAPGGNGRRQGCLCPLHP